MIYTCRLSLIELAMNCSDPLEIAVSPYDQNQIDAVNASAVSGEIPTASRLMNCSFINPYLVILVLFINHRS